VTVTLDSERLVSAGRLHLGAIQWRLRAGAPCAVTLRSSVDARVSNRFAATHFAQIDVIPWDAAARSRSLRLRKATGPSSRRRISWRARPTPCGGLPLPTSA